MYSDAPVAYFSKNCEGLKAMAARTTIQRSGLMYIKNVADYRKQLGLALCHLQFFILIWKKYTNSSTLMGIIFK